MTRKTSATGRFITLEGIDGAGKSTQVCLIGDILKKQNIPFIITREPGGTAGGDLLRRLLVQDRSFSWTKESEVLLHYAARIEHCRTIVKPALSQGQWVICDRFIDSTTAYQGGGQGVAEDFLKQMCVLTMGTFGPDQTFILDISPEMAMTRITPRAMLSMEQHYEGMGVDFFRRVRKRYLKIAKDEPKRCTVIKADGDVPHVHRLIMKHMTL